MLRDEASGTGQAPVLARLLGAAFRALLVVFLLAMPALLMPAAGDAHREIVALIALCAGALIFIEYSAAAPSILEFRDAPPFNRGRFLTLAATLLLLSIVLSGPHGASALQELLLAVGLSIGTAMDVSFSPVHLMVLVLGDGASPTQLELLRTVTGLAMGVSLTALLVMMTLMRHSNWPAGRGQFNLWVNLPTFDPNGGRDIVERLQWDARINIGVSLLLPFLIPVAIRVACVHFSVPLTLTPQSIVWIVTGWSFLPVALLLRGVALSRLANIIAERRRRASILGKDAQLFAI